MKRSFGRFGENGSSFAYIVIIASQTRNVFSKMKCRTFITLLIQAKGIIFATPVYNGGISAQTKAVMDRTRALVAADKNVFKGKIGMGIAVGGDRNGGQEFALMQIHTFYIINGMLPVSGGSFGANFGATFWSKDTLEGVKLDEEGFRSLRKTVKHFAGFMEKYGEK